MARCSLCGKGRVFGSSHRHKRGVAGGQWAKRAPRTVKIFKPNLHVAWVVVDGKRKKMRFCTKCLRKIKEAQKPVSAKNNVTAPNSATVS